MSGAAPGSDAGLVPPHATRRTGGLEPSSIKLALGLTVPGRLSPGPKCVVGPSPQVPICNRERGTAASPLAVVSPLAAPGAAAADGGLARRRADVQTTVRLRVTPQF